MQKEFEEFASNLLKEPDWEKRGEVIHAFNKTFEIGFEQRIDSAPSLGQHRYLRELRHSMRNIITNMDSLCRVSIRAQRNSDTMKKLLELYPDPEKFLTQRVEALKHTYEIWTRLAENTMTDGQMLKLAITEAKYRAAEKEPPLNITVLNALGNFQLASNISNLDFFSMLNHPLDNAIKCTDGSQNPGKGRIEINVGTRQKDGQEFLVFSVKDDGDGLSDNIKQALELAIDGKAAFPRELRGDNNKEKRTGTGFGMGELLSLLKQHDGYLEQPISPVKENSEDRPGTQMTLCLPILRDFNH